MSIITVTLNPAIDQTVTVDKLQVGQIHQAKSVHYNAGGKGIMVAACLADWNKSNITATGLLGTQNSEIFTQLLSKKGIHNAFIPIAGNNRTNIKIVDEKETTDLNLPGIEGSTEELDQVIKQVQGDYSLTILSGSLPKGLPVNSYQRLLAHLPSHNKVILDTSGEALIEALKGDRLPYCVKPNELELSQWAGETLTTSQEVLRAAQKLLQKGIGLVVISLGDKGAYFLSSQGIIHASLKPEKILTTVGAGDAMVAGIAAALSEEGDLERIARLSTAFAVTTLGYIGPHLPDPEIVEQHAQRVIINKIKEDL